ncbi:uncharacterized protein L3040_007666 [Drepanopeziza brunnea f. sp. 'multigermtubi']|uniref:uncharacterized protein n=1 Tax=Drepanopeziza brunnea f. sp. 'multigermtubi' TaxID=698441 RepID=UPI00239EE9EF|nr:hypothetical protein L3040_007666 [Drepanopeziza brunnea f. sp. 'multigermtubi']
MLPLSRTGTRSLRNPGLRTTSATHRIASSPVWIRSIARNNKPNNAPKKPTEFSRPVGKPAPAGPGGVNAAFNQPVQGARSSNKSGKPEYSKNQEEISKDASPERNKISQSAAANAKNAGSRGKESTEFSEKQEEFNTPASPAENTAPQSTSPSAVDPAKTQIPPQPLPDLTQGIPSTLEFEAMGRTMKTPLNLTEAEEQEAPGGGGRGRGELPASAYVSSTEKRRLQWANYMYAAFAVTVATGTVFLGRNWETEEEELSHPDAPSGWAVGLIWARAKARLGDQLNYYNEPAFRKLLPDSHPIFERPYTLVLSMEDLLVHSEWTREHGWRMAKRPGVDYFLRYLSQYYELVIFTSQPWAMAEPIIRKLDPYHIVTWPLFREATRYENGEYIKDLSYLNRDLSKVILIDTKAEHAQKQPENAIILKKWEGDPKDTELVALIPFLEYLHTMATPDVRKAISSFEGKHIPTEFARREAIARKKFHEQIAEEKKQRPKRSGVGMFSNALGIKHQNMMMDPADQSPAEAFAQGKMLQDQARERGQRNYEALEKEIRENGEKWLKEEAMLEEKAKEEGMKAMKSGFTSYLGGGGAK